MAKEGNAAPGKELDSSLFVIVLIYIYPTLRSQPLAWMRQIIIFILFCDGILMNFCLSSLRTNLVGGGRDNSLGGTGHIPRTHWALD